MLTDKSKTRSMLYIWIPSLDQNYNTDIFVFFNYVFQVWALKLYKKIHQPISGSDDMTEMAT